MKLTLVEAEPHRIELCKEWIRSHALPRKTVNPKAFAYQLKHEVERWRPGNYVTESAFRTAAKSLGYGVGPIYKMWLKPRNRDYLVRAGESFFVPWTESAG